ERGAREPRVAERDRDRAPRRGRRGDDHVERGGDGREQGPPPPDVRLDTALELPHALTRVAVLDPGSCERRAATAVPAEPCAHGERLALAESGRGEELVELAEEHR